jgi:hypothetical protein
MNLTSLISRWGPWVLRTPLALLLAALCSAGPSSAWAAPARPAEQDRPNESGGSDKDKPPAAVEVRFVDGSTLKLAVLDERLELNTPYGKLQIPVADIRQIDFGRRIAEEDARRIEAAVALLGSTDFHRRKAATEELAAFGEKAYPALRKAARRNDPADKANKSPDLEVHRRATELLVKLRQAVPEERLEVPDHDVVHTTDSKITGRLTAAALKVKTVQFGDQQLKLTVVRRLRSPDAAEAEPANALPDPGSLTGVQADIGQTLVFKVTGAPPGSAGVYGTGVYTTDSRLAIAAVHAGVLKPGQTGCVKVAILGQVAGFTASTQNGITSYAYGSYPGYRVSRP